MRQQYSAVIAVGVLAVCLVGCKAQDAEAPVTPNMVLAMSTTIAPLPRETPVTDALPAATGAASDPMTKRLFRSAVRANAAKQRPRTTAGAKTAKASKQQKFVETSPMFTQHIDGSSLGALLASVKRIKAMLPPEQAKGFNDATRVVLFNAMASLHGNVKPGTKVTDAMIQTLVAKALDGKTPWQVLVQAQQDTQQKGAKRTVR